MADMLVTIAHSTLEMLAWLTGFALAFSLLSRLTPCNAQQPLWRKDSVTDITYSLVMPIFTRFVHIAFLGVGVFLFFRNVPQETLKNYFTNGFGPLAAEPIWLQAAIIVLTEDVMLYWLHRWFHGKEMWRFHAIHHSPTHVDWLSTYRFHPVNTWLTFTLTDAIMLLCGFSPEAVATMAGANMIYSAMVHANLNWTFGPFKYVFASPVFHRWHHTAQEEGLDKNFAPTFPLIDIMFGTFYMPEGRVPEIYGVKDQEIPTNFISQLLWPFQNRD